MNTEPVICYYHADCFDGLAAAWVVRNQHPKALMKASCYHEPFKLPDIETLKQTTVYIVDFSFDIAEIILLCIYAKRVVFLDHHPVAEKLVQQLTDLTRLGFLPEGHHFGYELDQSGAMMTWKFFHGDAVPPPLIHHISDGDLYQWKDPKSKTFYAGLSLWPKTIDAWTYWLGCQSTAKSTAAIMAHGVSILSGRRQLAEIMVRDQSRLVEIGGRLMPIVKGPRELTGELFEAMVGEFSQYPGHEMCGIYRDTEERREFSLRSVGAAVNVIAALYGGQGHEKAAGFAVNREHHLALA